MGNMNIREQLAETYDEDLLFADSFDDAIIGIATGFDSGRVVYDANQMVAILVQEERFSEEEAWEFLEFNTFGAHVGEQTPLYVNRNCCRSGNGEHCG